MSGGMRLRADLVDVGNDPQAVFEAQAVAAAQVIVAIALGERDEFSRKQFDAAKYVVDRVLGKVGSGEEAEDGETGWKALLKELKKPEGEAGA